MIAAAVVTALRPGPPVLEPCLASLLLTGFDRPLIFAEPESLIARWVADKTEIVRRPKRFGEWQNWIYGLKETLERRPEADAVLMAQDDAVFCRRLHEFLEAHKWPSRECGAILVYTSNYYGRYPGRGLNHLPTTCLADLKGACAVLFPRSVACDIVEHAMRHGWRGHTRHRIDNPSEKHAVDTFIGETLAQLLREVWAFNPSLAEHEGDNSALYHSRATGQRRGLNFPGTDADPFVLFPVPEQRVAIRKNGHVSPIEVIVPSCKPREALAELEEAIKATAGGPVRVIVIATDASAAVNRNAGLDAAGNPIVVMIDDDVSGFPLGWARSLVETMQMHPDCVMVSAMLLRLDGRPGPMLGHPPAQDMGIAVVARRELPTACVAIRNEGLRFDEDFVGSGWEDTAYAAALRARYPAGTFLVNHNVRIVHQNEQKRQPENFAANRERYENKWGKRR